MKYQSRRGGSEIEPAVFAQTAGSNGGLVEECGGNGSGGDAFKDFFILGSDDVGYLFADTVGFEQVASSFYFRQLGHFCCVVVGVVGVCRI